MSDGHSTKKHNGTPIQINAAISGANTATGKTGYKLTYAVGGATLVLLTYDPLVEGCRALRAAGYNESDYVVINMPLVNGGTHQTYAARIDHGYHPALG